MRISGLKKAVHDIQAGHDLSSGDVEDFLDALISETDEALLADLFRAWHDKGIAENEIYSIAKIMRRRCRKIKSRHENFVDIVGTGGSKVKTFNVSTAAAFIVAGAGVPVAKHGNKAATSNTGSADVLSALGIEPAVNAATAERCLNEIGICFMFAPNFHRLSPTLGKVRRGLGFPTVFNCIGPLCNPASAPHQLIGVWDKELVPKMAGALAKLGTKKSWIVHGSDGLDEISLNGPTKVAEVEGGSVKEFTLSPEDFGVITAQTECFRADSADESAKIIKRLFAREDKSDVIQNVVLINASAALYLTGQAEDFRHGMNLALDSLDNGHARNKLELLASAVKS